MFPGLALLQARVFVTVMLALFVNLRSAILIALLPAVAVNLFSIAHVDPLPFKLLLAGLVFLYLGSHQLRLSRQFPVCAFVRGHRPTPIDHWFASCSSCRR